jgi:xanthine/uracil permease
MALDQFLQQSGLSAILDGSGQLRATRLVAETVYWGLLLLGFLTGLSAFNTELTSRIIATVVSLFPKVVTAAVILLAGLWLGQYLGRGALVWAFNEGRGAARECDRYLMGETVLP